VQRPLRDLATGALWDEGEAPSAQRTSSDPSPAAVSAAPFGRRSALRTSFSEPEHGRGGSTVLGMPAYPGASPPLSSNGGGGLSPRSAGGMSRGEVVDRQYSA